ncbi:MAG: DUF4393 domain-containing protein [Bacteroidales bacterium]|nr:DUF4393 domain-containing protein [Bacteroidales bacterium]
MKELSKDLIEKADGVALEIYKDALQPAFRPIGEIMSFLPRTVRLCLSGWEKWLINGEESLKLTAKAIEEKVMKIPEEKIVEPEPYVAIPAIQQLSYCQDNEDLRDLYANLLVSSMNADTRWEVHPAYVDIIKQLSPDEARIINSVANFKHNFLPLLDVKATDKNSLSTQHGGHKLIVTNFTTVGFNVIEHKENICKYVDNLVRLSLFEIPPTYHLTNPSLYIPLEESEVLGTMIDPYRARFDVGFYHKVLVITNLGLSFKRICCSR